MSFSNKTNLRLVSQEEMDLMNLTSRAIELPGNEIRDILKNDGCRKIVRWAHKNGYKNYRPGDLIEVLEPAEFSIRDAGGECERIVVKYLADGAILEWGPHSSRPYKLGPCRALDLPLWACRLYLNVKSVEYQSFSQGTTAVVRFTVRKLGYTVLGGAVIVWVDEDAVIPATETETEVRS